MHRLVAGLDPEIEEGGIHNILEWGLVWHAYSLWAYNAQSPSGVWGHVPLGKLQNLDDRRVLLRLSETTITTQNLWQLDCNLGELDIICSFLGVLSLQNRPLYSRHCHRMVSWEQQIWLLYVCRTWSSDSYRDVCLVGVATCAKHGVNIHALSLLSSEGSPCTPPSWFIWDQTGHTDGLCLLLSIYSFQIHNISGS